jgi:ATP-dependent helicase/nuclease subunit A
MALMKWTDEQLEAISESGANLLVSAAAGAGKTAVLVERIIRKITDESNPVDIDRLLVVTFTNAAASEMRERIGNALSSALHRNPGSKRLQKQMMLLNRANITTIHSFCLSVIRNNFHIIDLDPGFRIADQTETSIMKLEALDELFEEEFDISGQDGIFLKLVECYGGGRDDRGLKNIVLNLYNFVQSHPWPSWWLKQMTENLKLSDDEDFADSIWGKVLKEVLKKELEGFKVIMERAVRKTKKTPGLEPYLPAFARELSDIKLILQKTADWDGFYEALKGFDFDRLSNCKKYADETAKQYVKSLRDRVKKGITVMKKEIVNKPSIKIKNDLKTLLPLIEYLCSLVEKFEAHYYLKKKKKICMDFNDLEHYCLKILTEYVENNEIYDTKQKYTFKLLPEYKLSGTAKELQLKYDEILVDEYQDSNLVQEVIINAVSGKGSDTPNIFMVGDVKQSIYRFRQARPELFMDKYNTYPMEKGMRELKILLYKNFRSRKNIINSVNYIFRQIMSSETGELDYNENEFLNFGAVYFDDNRLSEQEKYNNKDMNANTDSELHIIDMSDKEEQFQNSGDEPDRIQCEARFTAERIRKLTGEAGKEGQFYIFDKKINSYRPVQYRDIVILLRTTSNWAAVFEEELGLRGIPVFTDTGTGYFMSVEIQTILSLLKIIDNPMQDIPLISVLRSPICGYSMDELVEIRAQMPHRSFYEALRKAAEVKNDELGEKLKAFLKKLDLWRSKACYMATDELIWYLYTETGYYSFTGGMPGGVQRQANLKILFERAGAFEKTSYRGLFNFINFIEKLKSGSGDMGSAKILGENENVVRIMSIHKSKGLEFPVVILSGCGKQFNFQDTNGKILFHYDLGFGPDIVNTDRRLISATACKQALKHKIKLETLSEEMRILYVAFTRAKEKLIITGTVNNIENSLSSWSESLYNNDWHIPGYMVTNGRTYLDWICPAVIRHKSCGSILRKKYGNIEDMNLIEDELNWNINIISKKNIIEKTAASVQSVSEFIEELKSVDEDKFKTNFQKEIKRRLEWKYPFEQVVKIPAKITVTELKRYFNAIFSGEEYPVEPYYTPPVVKRPSFLEDSQGMSAVEKGSTLHFVMQHLCLENVSNPVEINGQLDKMVKDKLITDTQKESVDVNGIIQLFHTEPGRRMLKAAKISRETPFCMEIESRDVFKDLAEDKYKTETFLLQGMIDCFFEESEELVLIDYKTDKIFSNGIEVIKKRYEVQIEYYAKALERLTGKKVKERYVYLFDNYEIVNM